MEQLPLFSDGELKPIRQYLHVWSEAQRASAIKNPQRDRLGNAVGNPENRVEEGIPEGVADHD